MHTLTFLGNDIACAHRWQRLAMEMAGVPDGVMKIRSGRPRHRVRLLR
jgi:hypothetical protein